ncbi:hypothetical protein PHYPSEUDO_003225 [Phytophthora pseudosyringae]|uniref:Uncharacterized protein n=1 Tax=Phytophthora pseudosyringae TaxID=221518 RepID=A0A8T1V6E8_9STRA|nr:hypothetical protein PHYPSEUDO_003225 [Phytophthora pseudosyringae]
MYLVHCDLSEMLSHSMVLHAKGPRRSHQVYDDGNWLGVMETVEWLYRARSIYRIEFITDDQPTLKPARKNKRKAKTRRSRANKKAKIASTSPSAKLDTPN